MTESTALTIIPAAGLPTILHMEKARALLDELKADVGEDFVPDASTDEGRKAIGRNARKVGTAKQAILKIAEASREDAKKLVIAVGQEMKAFEARMDALRDSYLEPLVAFKAIDATRVKALEDDLAHIQFLADDMKGEETAALLRARLAELGERYAARNDWQEFADRAYKLEGDVRFRLERGIRAAEKREAEAAELAALRAEKDKRDAEEAERAKVEREELIARQAAEKARREAEEQAERDRLAVIEAAARERAREAQEAEEKRLEEVRAREAAEAARDEAEQLAAEQARRHAEEVEKERRRQEAAAAEAERRAEAAKAQAVEDERRRAAEVLAAEEREQRQRAENRKRQGEVHSAIVRALIADPGLSEATAKAVVTRLAKGVDHVRIIY